MFGKMMNRFYYGKSGKGDYTREDLPETRWQLFWEMLRVRFSALFKLNILYMVAWLPAILVIGRCISMAYSGLLSLMEMQDLVAAGEMTAEVFAQNTAGVQEALRAILMQTLLLLIPAIGITGPFTAGAAYITRNWARDEHAFLWSDFWETVKGNWKQALPTSIITGCVPMLMYVCTVFYGQMAANNIIFMVPQVLVIMLGVIWLCSLMYTYPQMVTYEMKYGMLIRNSIIMTIGRLPMTVGLKLLSLVPAAIAVLVSIVTPYMIYAMLILAAYYILLGFALSRFVGASYANAVFDRYINVNIEGAQVNRGLYKEEDDEDEEEETPAIEESADL